VYIVSSTIGLVVWVPEVPLQESVISKLFSDTEQLFTLVAVHVTDEVLPDCNSAGVALIESSGLSTVIVIDPWPPFEHMIVYVVSLVGVTSTEPDVAPPVEKFTPALEEELTQVHESVAELPEFTKFDPENEGGVQRSLEWGDPQDAGITEPPLSPDGETEEIPNSIELMLFVEKRLLS